MTLHEQRSRCRQTEKRRVRFHYGHTDINLYSYDMGTGSLLAHIDHYQKDINNLNINSKLCGDVLDNVEVSGVSDVSEANILQPMATMPQEKHFEGKKCHPAVHV